MRWVLVLGWTLVAGWVSAEVPSDLDSPFHKTVILQVRAGQLEEFEIRRAKISENHLEMEKLDGSVVLTPLSKVLAVLPKLPAEGSPYTQGDAQKALALLQGAKNAWPDRPETSGRALAVWKELAVQASPYEEQRESLRTGAVQDWLKKIQPEEGKPQSIDLADYLKEGERLAKEGGVKSTEVQKRLEKIRSLMVMDFAKIRSKQLSTEWVELSLVVPLGLAVVLLFLGFWVVGNLSNFSAALKTGFVRTSQKGGESRTSINLKGIIYLLYAGGGSVLLYLLLHARSLPPEGELSEAAMGMAEQALYLSMNAKNRWSSQPKSSLEVETAAMVNLLQKVLPAGEFRLGQVLAYLGPKVVWRDGYILWRQTLRLAFIPMHLDFCFRPSAQYFSLETPTLESSCVGRIPLGRFLGNLIWDRFQPITTGWDQALGLQNGATWSWTRGEVFEVNAPQVLGRGDEKKEIASAGRKKAEFKESISALELVQIFEQGDGDVFINRTVNLTGTIKSVSSTRRLGNTVASEIARKTIATSGGAEAVNTMAPSGQEDFPDVFYLDLSSGGLSSKIQLKVLVKCPNVYYLDNRGDLYRSGDNQNVDAPVIPRQKTALFQGGRVEGLDRDTIEVYGAQPPIEAP